MKLNKKTKAAITVLLTAFLVDMWRNWPWTKKMFTAGSNLVGKAKKKMAAAEVDPLDPNAELE